MTNAKKINITKYKMKPSILLQCSKILLYYIIIFLNMRHVASCYFVVKADQNL